MATRAQVLDVIPIGIGAITQSMHGMVTFATTELEWSANHVVKKAPIS
ncbi:hypothetical protein SynA1825c_01384 [Synechococcus sp. A18-25c]|nr:hypothetical protein SynA1825c_01384 [Synechococcus sp. A18-25c]